MKVEICFIILGCISSKPELVILILLIVFKISNWLVGVK